jgi:hypothetical protein
MQHEELWHGIIAAPRCHGGLIGCGAPPGCVAAQARSLVASEAAGVTSCGTTKANTLNVRAYITQANSGSSCRTAMTLLHAMCLDASSDARKLRYVYPCLSQYACLLASATSAYA